MLTPKPSTELGPLTVPPRKAEIVLAEGNRVQLKLSLQLLDDLIEIEELEKRHVSLSEELERVREDRKLVFRAEFEQLQAKEERFGQFAEFLNRAASLAARAGDYEAEATYLQRARGASDDAFTRQRVTDSLLARDDVRAARRLLEACNLEVEAWANLRLAMLDVWNHDIESATARVEKAVSIDPLEPAARLFQGGLALFNGHGEKAIRAFRVASQSRGNSSILFTNLALAHFQTGEIEKTFAALRRAVALGPLNVNAVCILADVAFKFGRDEDAIPSLRYLVTREQKNAGVWSRLARACLQIGKYDEVESSLKHQAGIQSTSSVWNNLGVAYLRLNRRLKAADAFSHALQIGKDKPDRGYFLAARNLAQILFNADRTNELSLFIDEILNKDVGDLCLRDPALTELYAFRLHLLRAAGKSRELRRVATELLESPAAIDKIKMWAMGMAVSHGALCQDDSVLEFVADHVEWISSLPKAESAERTLLFNNVAFALAEVGKVQDAKACLEQISGKVGREPYPTATRGLIRIREGDFERGVRDYKKAIVLAAGRVHKSRIRQKLDLEQGKYWIEANPDRAKRFLDKAVRIQPGEELLTKQAKSILRQLKLER